MKMSAKIRHTIMNKEEHLLYFLLLAFLPHSDILCGDIL
jgi:hypothetical protein